MTTESVDTLYILGWVVVGLLVIWRIYNYNKLSTDEKKDARDETGIGLASAFWIIATLLFVIFFLFPMLTSERTPPEEDCYGIGMTYTC